MSTEARPQLILSSDENVQEQIVALEASNPIEPIEMQATTRDLPKVRLAFCAFRASNLAVLLRLNHVDSHNNVSQVREWIHFLGEWNQLTLSNLMELCQAWLLDSHLDALKQEAQTELMWMRQWLIALQDPRIHKYPSLPWRSFIKKIVSENQKFGEWMLKLAESSESEERRKENLIQETEVFLKRKKQVVCVFPKKWSS